MLSPTASKLTFYRDFVLAVITVLFGRLFPLLKLPPADFRGKVAIITGGNSGIGLEIATELVRQGATVYLACRNASKAKQAMSQIASDVPSCKGRVHVLSLDTSLLSSVRGFADTVRALDIRIDLLFHNAGTAASPSGEHFTSEGFPTLYATNFLGSFLLTYLLEPLIAENGRVILTSSASQYFGAFTSTFSLASIKGRLEPGFHVPATWFHTGKDSAMYNNTKAMQVAFAKLLQRHFDRTAKEGGRQHSRVAHAFHPGYSTTQIFGKFAPNTIWDHPLFWAIKMFTPLAISASQGAATAVWLAGTADKNVIDGGNGGSYWDRMTRRVSTIDMMSQDTLQRLWLRWEADSGVEWR